MIITSFLYNKFNIHIYKITIKSINPYSKKLFTAQVWISYKYIMINNLNNYSALNTSQ